MQFPGIPTGLISLRLTRMESTPLPVLEPKESHRVPPSDWIIRFLVFLLFPHSGFCEVDYQKSIKPLLKERCFSCHGALKQKAGLRLDTVELMRKGGESGPAILPRNVQKSPLWERVTSKDESELMPPKHEGAPFNEQQLAQLREWISQGARGFAGEKPEQNPREHWAFKLRERPPVPSVRESNWVRNPVDAFLLARLETEGLRPAPEASREMLVRRLYLDLIGLPPSWKELQQALHATQSDWYERLVDQLLADPRHGERWARHWMDIWRYSDWWGLGEQLRNSQKHMWHFRDWIIESLNTDTPYDEMVRLMLAADEIAPMDPSKLRATGFLARNWFLFNRNTWMEDTVEHVGKGLLGLTMNCTKCHDHKYDPISQTDFYQMRAVFEPYHVRMDLTPGEADIEKDGIPRAFDGAMDVPTYRFIRGEESRPDKSRQIEPAAPQFFTGTPLHIQPVQLPVEATEPERQPWVLDAHIASAKKQLERARESVTQAETKLQKTQPAPPSKVTNPAQVHSTSKAEESALEIARLSLQLADRELESAQRRAVALRAHWKNPDSQKTTESRIEAVRADRNVAVAAAAHAIAVQKSALAKATSDKKSAAEKKLKTLESDLDKALAKVAEDPHSDETFRPLPGSRWVPTRFASSAKDDPSISFPKISSGRRKALAQWITDPGNPLTARVAVNHLWGRHFGFHLAGTPFDLGRSGAIPTHPELLNWLASEFVEKGWSMKHLHRLLVTSSVYRMSSSSKGRETELSKDPDNKQIWRRLPIRLEAEVIRDSLLSLSGTLDPQLGGPSIPANAQATSHRRSLYFFHSNNDRNLFLTTFDGPMVRECYRREQSVVPQQALAMANSALCEEAYKLITARIEGHIQEQRDNSDASFVNAAFLYVTGLSPSSNALEAGLRAIEQWKHTPDGSVSKQSARAPLLWVLLNHNDFVTLR